MLHRRDGAKFPPDVTLGIQAKVFNLGFIRPENHVSRGLRVFKCFLANCNVTIVEKVKGSEYFPNALYVIVSISGSKVGLHLSS